MQDYIKSIFTHSALRLFLVITLSLFLISLESAAFEQISETSDLTADTKRALRAKIQYAEEIQTSLIEVMKLYKPDYARYNGMLKFKYLNFINEINSNFLSKTDQQYLAKQKLFYFKLAVLKQTVIGTDPFVTKPATQFLNCDLSPTEFEAMGGTLYKDLEGMKKSSQFRLQYGFSKDYSEYEKYMRDSVCSNKCCYPWENCNST